MAQAAAADEVTTEEMAAIIRQMQARDQELKGRGTPEDADESPDAVQPASGSQKMQVPSGIMPPEALKALNAEEKGAVSPAKEPEEKPTPAPLPSSGSKIGPMTQEESLAAQQAVNSIQQLGATPGINVPVTGAAAGIAKGGVADQKAALQAKIDVLASQDQNAPSGTTAAQDTGDQKADALIAGTLGIDTATLNDRTKKLLSMGLMTPDQQAASDQKRTIGLALLGALPILAGGLLGGRKGAAAGGMIGGQAVEQLNAQQQQRELENRKNAQAMQQIVIGKELEGALLHDKLKEQYQNQVNLLLTSGNLSLQKMGQQLQNTLKSWDFRYQHMGELQQQKLTQQGQNQQAVAGMRLSQAQQGQVIKLQQNFNKIMDAPVKTLQVARKADQLLNSNTPMTAAIMRPVLAQLNGESKRIPIQEMQSYGGDPSLIGQGEQLYQTLAHGNLTPDNVELFKKIMANHRMVAESIIRDHADFMSQQGGKALNISPDQMQNYFSTDALLNAYNPHRPAPTAPAPKPQAASGAAPSASQSLLDKIRAAKAAQ